MRRVVVRQVDGAGWPALDERWLTGCEQRLERCLRGLPGVSCSCCLSRRERGDETGTQRAASVSQSAVTRAHGKARSVGAARQAGIADRHSRIPPSYSRTFAPPTGLRHVCLRALLGHLLFSFKFINFFFNYRRRRKLLVSGA